MKLYAWYSAAADAAYGHSMYPRVCAGAEAPNA